MRRTLLLAGVALVAGLGAPDRPAAADRAPLTLGPAELHSIAVRRMPPVEAAAVVDETLAAPPALPEATVAEPALPEPYPGPEPAAMAEPQRLPAAAAPVAATVEAVVLAPAELQAIGPRPRPASPVVPIAMAATPLPAPMLSTIGHPRPSRRPASAVIVTEIAAAPSGAAAPTTVVLAPAELQAIGPRARPNAQPAPSPQPRPTRLVFTPGRIAAPVLVPDEPAVSLQAVEPLPDQPARRTGEGPATLDDAGLAAFGVRIGAAP